LGSDERIPHIQVILASTRQGRFGEKAAAWMMDRLHAREDLLPSWSTFATTRALL
jgi:NAD(P)H-dependent FMN reductase